MELEEKHSRCCFQGRRCPKSFSPDKVDTVENTYLQEVSKNQFQVLGSWAKQLLANSIQFCAVRAYWSVQQRRPGPCPQSLVFAVSLQSSSLPEGFLSCRSMSATCRAGHSIQESAPLEETSNSNAATIWQTLQLPHLRVGITEAYSRQHLGSLQRALRPRSPDGTLLFHTPVCASFLFYFSAPQVLSGITIKINYFHSKLCFQVCFWRNPT